MKELKLHHRCLTGFKIRLYMSLIEVFMIPCYSRVPNNGRRWNNRGGGGGLDIVIIINNRGGGWNNR